MYIYIYEKRKAIRRKDFNLKTCIIVSDCVLRLCLHFLTFCVQKGSYSSEASFGRFVLRILI